MIKLKINFLLLIFNVTSLINSSYNPDTFKKKYFVFNESGYLDVKEINFEKLAKDAEKLSKDTFEEFDKPYPISIKRLYLDKELLAVSDDHSQFILHGDNEEERIIAYIYDKKSCLKTVHFLDSIYYACFSPSLNTFALSGINKTSIHKMDDPNYTFEINKAAEPFIFYGEDYLLATIGGEIEKIDLKTQKRVKICNTGPFHDTSLFLRSDKLFFVDFGYKLNILDLNNNTIIKKFDIANKLASVSKTGLLAYLDKDFKTIIVRNIFYQENPVTIKLLGESYIYSLAFSPCEKYLASGTTKEDSQINIWDWHKQTKIAQFACYPKSPIIKILCNPNGKSIIAENGYGHCLKIKLSHLKDLLEARSKNSQTETSLQK